MGCGIRYPHEMEAGGTGALEIDSTLRRLYSLSGSKIAAKVAENGRF